VKEPVWVELREVLATHDRLLVLHGGASGLRDSKLLESALARPQQLFAYGDNSGIVDMAAAYTGGIVRNHPFVDGNKRAGFVVGVLFLEMNGFEFTASEEEATQAILGLAAGKLSEAALVAWFKQNAKRPSR
jgi:death-on-curing protein